MKQQELHTAYHTPNWSTRIYVLLAVAVAVGAVFLNPWHTNWALTILVAVGVVLFVESLILTSRYHPGAWRLIKWGILLLLALLLLTGFGLSLVG